MLSKTIFASAPAVVLCFAAFAASNSASAAPRGGLTLHVAPVLLVHGGRNAGPGGVVARPNTGGRTRCWSAECGGGTVPIDNRFVVRGCQFLKGEALPPWCQGLPGAPRGATRAIRY